MAAKIFINYRRGDDPGYAGRLCDQLREAFGTNQVFMDVQDIAPGDDFVKVLTDQVSSCDVLLVVIGKSWTKAKDADGERRLDNPQDFVRIEIEAALRLGKRVVPVLVNRAEMPTAEQLPESLRALVRRNAVRLTHERFNSDVQGLISDLPVDAKTAPEHQYPFPSAPAKQPPAFFFLKDEVLANFGYPGEQEYQFGPASPITAGRAAYIRLFPQSVQRQPGLSKLMELFQSRKIASMSRTIGGLVARNQYGPIIIDAEGAHKISGLTQGFPSGELWGVSDKIFLPQSLHGYKGEEKILVIPVISFEKLIGKTLENYVHVAESDLRFEPPFTVEIGASGLREVFLACPGGLVGEGSFEGPITEDIFFRKCELNSTDDASITTLLKSVFIDFYDLAACDRGKIITHDLVRKYGLVEN